MSIPQMSTLASTMIQSLAHQIQQQTSMEQIGANQTPPGSDPNDPNAEMLLALIARNKALEGEYLRLFS